MNARQKGCYNNSRQAGATISPLPGVSAREASLKRRTFENGHVVKEQRVTVERQLFSFSVVKKRKNPCRPNLFNPSQWGRWAAEGGRGGQLRSALSNGECVVVGGGSPSILLFVLPCRSSWHRKSQHDGFFSSVHSFSFPLQRI